MQEFIAINEQRAEFYWWMSSLFATELTQEDLNNYHGGDMDNYYSVLAMTDKLKAPIASFREALTSLKSRDDAQLELAADFCGLFLSTPKTGALPYASMYIGESGLLNDKPAQEMGQWMEKYGIAQRKDFNEPFDHLAVVLDFMGNLIVMANAEPDEAKQEALMQEQQAFLETMVLPWIDMFRQALHKYDAFGFYKASGDLLNAFIALDLAFLKGE
ncbi:molecular chaperone TorD [Enterovibrio norvegicus]|uniref:molecular chaperone TorD n=1 Tax=Enterovibrio norvegicus TaxID=188144 RepID=UPI000C838B29|nr:molecular chaperone TorD [Enterovibrio norvegicus]MCC4797191.1 molecular chaperone TorD [Enterovibrio norvegicus]PMI26924.1 molecular chaperone TorD [Enterovibrio norvegicus]PMI35326.1 molecular chaperone TorD [Enterovibrio norvegicus]PMN56198.1 molecular chaperone TorD [Enterovibrio norvegicus]TKF08720.1 molecular chaperone TorD [Enterovibrio norvegicus]